MRINSVNLSENRMISVVKPSDLEQLKHHKCWTLGWVFDGGKIRGLSDCD